MVLVLLLCLFPTTIASAVNNDPCGVSGNWTNQFGSLMVVSCQTGPVVPSEGSVTGRYMYTANSWYDISGRYTMINGDCILGFSIAIGNNYGNSNITSWTGIHYASEDNIHTQWFLSKHTEYNDMWKNTHFGSAVFTRESKGGNGGGVIG